MAQQQKGIMNFFKPMAKEQKEPQPQEAAKEQSAGGVRGSNRMSISVKRPPDSDDKQENSSGAADSEVKRPRLSAETPPRPQAPAVLQPSPRPPGSSFVPQFFSPSSAGDVGKENQQQVFLAAQPAAVQSLLTGFGSSWLLALKPELTKSYFAQLAEFVRVERAAQGKVVFPPPADVFSWTRVCRLQDVKVVILGQDPYHGPNQAHGLCFSVRRPTASPPSLLNIYKEVSGNFPGQFQSPGHGDLTGWAEQGVLLLNAVLTVRRGEANSHQGRGWETFTDAVVSTLNARFSNLVFILWGNYAQKKGAKIDKRRHRVICGAHPSPLAANQGGFFGKMYFKEANDYLKSVGKTPIDWCHLP